MKYSHSVTVQDAIGIFAAMRQGTGRPAGDFQPLRTRVETVMNRIATAVLAAVIGATPILATTTDASAGSNYKNGKLVRYGKPHNRGGSNDVNWGGVGAGFVAGAALGVGAGLLINRPPPPVYYAPPPPPPVYYAPAPPPVVYYQPASPAYYSPPPGVYYDGYDRGWTEAHVEWCLDRYRSYNPATNTFTGYDGLQYECRGPY
jgi:hypothetical protein